MKAETLFRHVAEILNDAKYRDWKESQLLEWLNDGLRAIAIVHPDAFEKTVKWQLMPGIVQSLPPKALRLLGSPRNLGADGQTPRRVVRGPVPRELLDAINPDWPTEAPSEVVEEYIYDENTPKTFHVRPPVNGQPYIEAPVAMEPEPVTDKGQDIPCDEVYAPALIEWMLYRCFARDSEDTPNFARSQRHAQMFFNLLGVKARADLLVLPKGTTTNQGGQQP